MQTIGPITMKIILFYTKFKDLQNDISFVLFLETFNSSFIMKSLVKILLRFQCQCYMCC
jgi:hypothetical protein